MLPKPSTLKNLDFKHDMLPAEENPSRHSASILDLSDADFSETVIQSKQPFCVMIGAEWSGECFILEPIFKQLANDYSDQLNFARVNIDLGENITHEYGVTDLPFFLFFRNGELVGHLIGLQSKTRLEQQINNMLKSNPHLK